MKRKNLLKKISLGAVGVASIGAIAFGVSKIVQFCKNDTKTLSLDYSVGALTDEGKYQEDECKLYTKKAFACDGLRVTFDFDAEVNGQFYFYDINDKYLSKSNVITEGSSVSVPLNGAYARAVVIPTNDEDGSISFTEKYKYGSQMQVKVNKDAEKNISKIFYDVDGKCLRLVDNIGSLKFTNSKIDYKDGIYSWSSEKSAYASTSLTLLDVTKYKSVSFDISNVYGYSSSIEQSGTKYWKFLVYSVNDNGSIVDSIEINSSKGTSTINFDQFDEKPKKILLSIYCDYIGISLTESVTLNGLSTCFTLSK